MLHSVQEATNATNNFREKHFKRTTQIQTKMTSQLQRDFSQGMWEELSPAIEIVLNKQILEHIPINVRLAQ